ncbi:MAG: AMP-binding protein [Solirubrobacteraceae bacterium]
MTATIRTGISVARATMRPQRPDRLLRGIAGTALWGPTMAGGFAGATARHPSVHAVIDEQGPLTYWELWAQTDAVARELRRRGVGPGVRIGLLARDHRGFVVALLAASKTGADIVLLNTGFAGQQLRDVLASEGVELLLHDDEFAPVVAVARPAASLSASEIERLGQERDHMPLRPTRHQGRLIVMTSGTTGRPKGATRTSRIGSVLQVLASLPLRARDTVVVATPLFHSWGLGHLAIGLGFSSTAILRRTFDPQALLEAIDRHRPDGLVVVPIMLHRILDLGGEEIARYDTSSLRYIACSGSALGAALATEVMNRFGPILYNAYGSTEVSLATVASPRDLQQTPSTAGRVVPGTVVRILSDSGSDVPTGEIGRIFVGSGGQFDGYTDGSSKSTVGGLVSTGDLGHFDSSGRLFIDGREDEMIISGGENVFPAEVEALLMRHPAVQDVAVIGVPDAKFGQRLKALIVRRDDATLTAEDVVEHVRGQLARYKTPGTVEFVAELPRTTTGKLRRVELT